MACPLCRLGKTKRLPDLSAAVFRPSGCGIVPTKPVATVTPGQGRLFLARMMAPDKFEICQIEIVFSALHRTIFYAGKDTGLFMVVGTDGSTFFAGTQPSFFDAQARRVTAYEILPGSVVNVCFTEEPRYRQVKAVQIVSEPPSWCPFRPLLVDCPTISEPLRHPCVGVLDS